MNLLARRFAVESAERLQERVAPSLRLTRGRRGRGGAAVRRAARQVRPAAVRRAAVRRAAEAAARPAAARPAQPAAARDHCRCRRPPAPPASIRDLASRTPSRSVCSRAAFALLRRPRAHLLQPPAGALPRLWRAAPSPSDLASHVRRAVAHVVLSRRELSRPAARPTVLDAAAHHLVGDCRSRKDLIGAMGVLPGTCRSRSRGTMNGRCRRSSRPASSSWQTIHFHACERRLNEERPVVAPASIRDVRDCACVGAHCMAYFWFARWYREPGRRSD